MPQVQRSIPYTFDAYSGGVFKDPGGGGEIARFPAHDTYAIEALPFDSILNTDACGLYDYSRCHYFSSDNYT